MSYLASKTSSDRPCDHLNGVQVVGGSNPPIPTNQFSLKKSQSSANSSSILSGCQNSQEKYLTLYIRSQSCQTVNNPVFATI